MVYASPPTISPGVVAYGNGNFLTFGTNAQFKANYILESTNGITWTPIYQSSNALFSATYGNNTWVFIGNNEIVTANVTSTNWSWHDYQPSFTPNCIAYANGAFVIEAFIPLSAFTYAYSTLSSSDGVIWLYKSNLIPSSGYGAGPSGIAFGNGIYVTVTVNPEYLYGSVAYASSDLINWALTESNIPPPSAFFRPVAYGGNIFISSFGSNKHTCTSPDGNAWTPSLNVDCNALVYGQGTFVAVSSNIVYQSNVFASDSNSPAPTTLGISTYPGVTINGTAGAVYRIESSTDLNTWQTLTNFPLPYSPYIWVDTSSTMAGQRFYRSVQLQ